MIKISDRIIEENITQQLQFKQRNTIRAVILNPAHEIFLLYSKKYDDYTFPGGGIKGIETHEDTLRRELREEIGATEIKIIRPLGYLEELRYGIHGDENVYLQTSYYYLVDVLERGLPQYVDFEKYQGLETRFVPIDLAVQHNIKVMYDDKHRFKGLKTVLPRENTVLNYIKEHLHEIL